MILTLNLLEESLHIYALQWLLIYIYYFKFQITYPYFIFQLIFLSFRGGALGSRETAQQLERLAFPETQNLVPRVHIRRLTTAYSSAPTALGSSLYTGTHMADIHTNTHTYI